MVNSLKLADFDFQLPESMIAQKPLATRDQSKLMVLNRKSGSIKHEIFSNFPQIIPSKALVVFNDTQVVPSKLNGFLTKNARPIEVLLVRETDENHWEVLIKGLGKLRLGAEMEFGNGELKATLKGRKKDTAIIKLIYKGQLNSILSRIAKMPLPPYIRRKTSEDCDLSNQDRKRYQTIFARHPGAIAAPTAGLHFTPDIFESLKKNGIYITYLTLHVGMGTFQPIRTENVVQHKMQAEQFYIPEDTSKALVEAKRNTQKIIGIGSTTTRVLESIDLSNMKMGGKSGWTDRFIYPGQKFKVVDHMLTNFHLPKSTLYLLVCTFAGKSLIEKAYEEAMKQNYRFFSYGDAMLIL